MRTRFVVSLLVGGAILWILISKKVDFLVIQSGSMEPAFGIGDLIIVKPMPEYQTGDVITFKSKDGRIITHRITRIDEKNLYQTKGDANRMEDYSLTTKEQVVGRVIQVLPKVGLLANFARTTTGFAVLFLLPMGFSIVGEVMAMQHD